MMGMLLVLTFDYIALLDLGVTLSFVMSYMASRFKNLLECSLKPFVVSTPIGKSILVERVYRDCVVSIHFRDTFTGLIELEMIDYDVILGMD